jgi:hypothetical protein
MNKVQKQFNTINLDLRESDCENRRWTKRLSIVSNGMVLVELNLRVLLAQC